MEIHSTMEKGVSATTCRDTKNSVSASVETLHASSLQTGDIQQQQLVYQLQKYILDNKNHFGLEMERDVLYIALSTNRKALSEAVRVVTGEQLLDYINRMLLNKARKMLEERPNLPVKAIAENCGFTYRSFNRLFREHFYFSPAKYRKIKGC